MIRYDTIIRWLKEHKPDIVIVREELDPAHASEELAYMHRLWERC